MKITNNTTNDVEITDLLLNSTASQFQDGVRTLIIPASDYRIIPNLQGGNSPAIKALVTATTLTVDRRVEPTGAEPTKEVGGPIVGLPLTVA